MCAYNIRKGPSWTQILSCPKAKVATQFTNQKSSSVVAQFTLYSHVSQQQQKKPQNIRGKAGVFHLWRFSIAHLTSHRTFNLDTFISLRAHLCRWLFKPYFNQFKEEETPLSLFKRKRNAVHLTPSRSLCKMPEEMREEAAWTTDLYTTVAWMNGAKMKSKDVKQVRRAGSCRYWWWYHQVRSESRDSGESQVSISFRFIIS